MILADLAWQGALLPGAENETPDELSVPRPEEHNCVSREGRVAAGELTLRVYSSFSTFF